MPIWLQAVVGFFTSFFQSLFVTDHIAAIIIRDNFEIGPMATTGGVIHKVSTTTAVQVAGYIREYAPKFGLDPADVMAVARGEGDFDPNAIDPNNQDAKPGETPEQQFLHTDLGIEQEDGSTAIDDPEFRGKTWEEMRTVLLDPEYGIQYICERHSADFDWAREQIGADPSLKTKVPYGNIGPEEVLAYQAYNSGRNGALHIAHTLGRNGNWSYGLQMAARAAAYHKELNT